ncbi:hypothetical protein V6N12_007479 [Hibiscus sabdariffa]|uniref:Uncharacterized protein n=1 Tax=Hibiscus sabdariffa TaxID=183260 RepID=A0ABR2F1V7_9ROSI
MGGKIVKAREFVGKGMKESGKCGLQLLKELRSPPNPTKVDWVQRRSQQLQAAEQSSNTNDVEPGLVDNA